MNRPIYLLLLPGPLLLALILFFWPAPAGAPADRIAESTAMRGRVINEGERVDGSVDLAPRLPASICGPRE